MALSQDFLLRELNDPEYFSKHELVVSQNLWQIEDEEIFDEELFFFVLELRVFSSFEVSVEFTKQGVEWSLVEVAIAVLLLFESTGLVGLLVSA